MVAPLLTRSARIGSPRLGYTSTTNSVTCRRNGLSTVDGAGMDAERELRGGT